MLQEKVHFAVKYLGNMFFVTFIFKYPFKSNNNVRGKNLPKMTGQKSPCVHPLKEREKRERKKKKKLNEGKECARGYIDVATSAVNVQIPG